ncbi:sugar kinase [Thalassotalea sp. SU-HH00458]|uniref:sugar kinase n=1 Tax=Thalassotalea sp. SU-HH00458 TaxID=3127657 RepID=UPI0031075330
MKNIAVMGECMVEFGSAELPQTYKQGFAGDVFNTGIYIKRCVEQKATVNFLSAIGNDELSDQLIKLMTQENLNNDLLYRSNTEKMGLYLINVDDEGERSFTYWRKDSAATKIMQFIESEETFDKFAQIDSLFFSGISLAILSESDLTSFWSFLASIKNFGVKIIFDPNYRPTLWQGEEAARKAFNIAFSLSDVVLPGVEDHMALYGAKSAEDVADYLEELGVEEIVIKNGPESILISEKGKRAIIDVIPAHKVVDTTSAGDAFNGGYLSARIMGRSIEQAALFAANVAKCVIQHKGAIVDKKSFSEHLTKFPM